ncbi:2-deoxystreptamine glucosyltransferase [Posidoniimonas corsicana]|uniref:2-deoxystreptamine glucosyltransferase n=1 Tax=Posidoniimonas corsicana TaxID=1938618 RepID=A0A5C5UZU5_9BACT|nr:glycosyltransferase family 4 protein [Posidoniimonas corsicana]TWT31012.1 2-deoxystreptamine glucosyltransferase [Posidoniimonas corsicana]
MKIAYIAAGAAGMYCGSCLHDNTLAAAMLRQGEDVVLVPTYTPIRTDAVDVSHNRVFMGGVNAYLLQTSRLFRLMPRWLTGLLDRPGFLSYVTRGAGSVDPAKLGGMTVSMLQGELGNQAAQLDELVDWLLEEIKPDVVHLSNSMLIGMARRINERCGPPVVCALSGEDIFLEALRPPHYEQARELLRERAAEVQAFTALNGYYADFMADYLSVDRQKVHVIPHGLNLEGHGKPDDDQGSPTQTVGYLARICHDKGLHLLVEACTHLAASRPDLDFRVKAAGYLGKADRAYLSAVTEQANSGPLAGRFEYLGELDRDQKLTFLKSLDVFSTPTVYRESKGLPAIEALANGVPLVLPEHGAFPEFVRHTGGGLLFPPGDVNALAAQIARLLTERAFAKQLSDEGHGVVHDHYHDERMARETVSLYQELAASKA